MLWPEGCGTAAPDGPTTCRLAQKRVEADTSVSYCPSLDESVSEHASKALPPTPV
ncbi:hypothetical protein PC116_g34574 [Phytophthora cactorum]|nr:hypothetical protein PC116_g34574 [Phytophthora cactorum]